MRSDYCPIANEPCQCMCVTTGNGRCCLREKAQDHLNDEQIARAWAGGDHNASAATKRRITRAIEAEPMGVKK